MKKHFPLSLIIGDLAIFIASLWLTLAVRNWRIPTEESFFRHLAAFALLFVVWFIVFVLAGVYDRGSLIMKSKLTPKVIMAQIVNLIIAAIFFYTLPIFGIAPKIVLFLYLLISTLIILFWRLKFYPTVRGKKANKIMLLGKTKTMMELEQKMLSQNYSGLDVVYKLFTDAPDFEEQYINNNTVIHSIRDLMKQKKLAILALDYYDDKIKAILPQISPLIFEGLQFASVYDLYEDFFDMEPLESMNDSWIIENTSMRPAVVYDIFKRLMDLVISFPFFLVSLIVYPFVWVAIKLDDGGPIFLPQIRIGEGGREFTIVKFRSMRAPKSDAGEWVDKSGDDRITKVGRFIRKTRIDELPQLISVIKGDQSLIGPRPELPKMVDLYNQEIPFYNIRHIIKPGLSGWAQIHHELPPQSIDETRLKLAYDLYYIRHRSLMLDLKIAFATIKTLLSRTGI